MFQMEHTERAYDHKTFGQFGLAINASSTARRLWSSSAKRNTQNVRYVVCIGSFKTSLRLLFHNFFLHVIVFFTVLSVMFFSLRSSRISLKSC